MSAPTSDKAGIRQVIRTLRANGFVITCVDEEDFEPRALESAIIDEAMAADEAYIYVSTNEGERAGYVYVVLGNAPDEVVCDYTTNLECIDTLTEGWYFG